MEVINEKNEVESVVLPEASSQTIEGIIRLNVYPHRRVLKEFDSLDDLSCKMAKVPLEDGTSTFVFSTHVDFENDPKHCVEFIIHMTDKFEVLHYGVYFIQFND